MGQGVMMDQIDIKVPTGVPEEPVVRPSDPAWLWQRGGWLRQREDGFMMGINRHACSVDGCVRYRPFIEGSGSSMTGIWVDEVGVAEADAARLVAFVEDYVAPNRLSHHDQVRRDRALNCDRKDLESLKDAIGILQSTDNPSLLHLYDELVRCCKQLDKA